MGRRICCWRRACTGPWWLTPLPSASSAEQSAGRGLANPSLSREVLGLPAHAASLFLGLIGWWAEGDVICAPQISAVRRQL